MTMQNTRADIGWGDLASLPETEREAKMRARYQELAKLNDEERVNRMLAMAQAEYALDDAKLRSFTTSRMRVWINLDEATAKAVVAAYDQAMDKMPGAAAMRRVALVQNLALTFPIDEQAKLRVLVPKIFAGRSDISQLVKQTATTAPQPEAEKPKKSGWGFWKK